jgi:4-hydroxy-4-methyl-2-oxoglutarate aldolase
MNNNPSISRRKLLGVAGSLTAASALIPGFISTASALARPDPMIIPAGLREANVSLITSSLQKIGFDPIKQSMSTDIKPLVPIGRTMIGPAVTTKWEIGRGPWGKEDVDKYYFDVLDNAVPGSVWVIASGTERIYSLYGDVICSALKRDGMAGVVSDNGCRDIADIEALDLPVFGKATVQYGPPKNFIRPVAGNVPVICGGAEVRPGDLVAADGDGVIVMPKESLVELEKAVIAHQAKEDNIRERIRNGEPLKTAYPKAD